MKTILLGIPLFLVAGCSGSTMLEGDGSTEDAAETPTDGVAEEAVLDVADIDSGTDDGGAPGCEPQDAAFGTACRPGVFRWLWDGGRCVEVDAGLGCECVGADCDETYSSVAACVEARRSCYTNDCEPQAVSDDACLDCDTEEFLGAFWDGRACFEMRGCQCTGAGCDGAFASVAECEAVGSVCPAARCAATGGAWFPEQAGGCGFACGGFRDEDCLVPFADCLCPDGQTFDREAGCAEDPTCTARERCVATAGAWHPEAECICGYTCGMPGMCGACLDSCDCGPHRTFDPALGCLVDPTCPPAESERICASTGGTWGDFGCDDPHCGIPNYADPCVGPGCDCGRGANFDPVQGCVPDASCFLRREGADCTGRGMEWSSCRPGLACCAECGDWPGCTFCRPPCCPEGSFCESDGCPPPPP